MNKSVVDNKIPQYNSRIIDTYIKFIKKNYSHFNIKEILAYANMKPYEVADQEHWFNQNQINLFYEKVVQLTNGKSIAREAGRYAASPDSTGVMRQYMLGMVRPAKVFELISRTAKNFTRSSVFESRKIDSNKFEITVTYNEGVSEMPFQCENRIGYLEMIVMLFSNKLPKIEHSECIFRGGKVCRYIVSWEKSLSIVWKRLRNISLLISVAAITVLLSIGQFSAFYILLPLSIIVFLSLTLLAERLEKHELKAGLRNLEDSKEKLLEVMKVNYNDARMINEIGQAVSNISDVEVFENVVKILENRLDYDRGMILLVNNKKNRLIFRAGYGYSKSLLKYIKESEFHLDRPESRGVFVMSIREQKPLLINDINSIENDLSPRSVEFARKMKTQSFICCPIIVDDESIGLLVVDNIKTNRPLIDSDLSILTGVAHVLGISIKNAELHDERIRQFRSILQGLAASIDARDPLTAGHSERVTNYAVGICSEMELPVDYTDVIRVAASLHDYGKLAIPDALLLKQGQLTKDEYNIIKTHSIKTREILEQIEFHGIFSQVPEIASSHHEKVDGSGYPSGLKGDEIPLGSQIIAVADFFEAVTAKRHYREPMPIDLAFDMLKAKKGLYFKEEIIDHFINYYIRSIKDKPIETKGL